MPTDAPFNLEETDRLLSTTRAVRRRLDLDRPVERSVITDCLRLAVQAPTATNRQTWRWMVVTDAAKRAEIARIYGEVGASYLAHKAETTEEPQTRRVYESASALTSILHRVPVHVIPCVAEEVDMDNFGSAAATFASIIPAAWSFQLALRSRGLGSVYTTLHLFQADQVAALLGIPDGVTQLALIPVAYTVGTDFKPATRPPVEDITYWDTWSAE